MSKTTKKLDKIAEIFVLSFVEIAIVVTLLALAILEQVSKYRNTLVGNFVIALGNNNRVAKGMVIHCAIYKVRSLLV